MCDHSDHMSVHHHTGSLVVLSQQLAKQEVSSPLVVSILSEYPSLPVVFYPSVFTCIRLNEWSELVSQLLYISIEDR